MNSFEFVKRDDKQLAHATLSSFQVYKKNKSEISHEQISAIVRSLQSKAPRGTKIRVRALNVDRWTTLKGFDEDLDLQSEEDYLDGRVHETTKFLKAFQLEIILMKPKPK